MIVGRPRNFNRHEVAVIVREATEVDVSPVRALMEVLGVNRRRATYMVKVCRDNGMLPPPKPRPTSSHRPAPAVINRNTSRHRTFWVCEECLTPWPCPLAPPEPDYEDDQA